jgi:hypothetical protein
VNLQRRTASDPRPGSWGMGAAIESWFERERELPSASAQVTFSRPQNLNHVTFRDRNPFPRSFHSRSRADATGESGRHVAGTERVRNGSLPRDPWTTPDGFGGGAMLNHRPVRTSRQHDHREGGGVSMSWALPRARRRRVHAADGDPMRSRRASRPLPLPLSAVSRTPLPNSSHAGRGVRVGARATSNHFRAGWRNHFVLIGLQGKTS